MNGRGWLPWVLCIAAGASLAAWQVWRMRPVAAPKLPAPVEGVNPKDPAPRQRPPFRLAVGEAQAYRFHINRRSGDAVVGGSGRMVLRLCPPADGSVVLVCRFERVDKLALIGPGASADPEALAALTRELVGEVRLSVGLGGGDWRILHEPEASPRRREIHDIWARVWTRVLADALPPKDLQVEWVGEGWPRSVRGGLFDTDAGARIDVDLESQPDEDEQPLADPPALDGAAIAELERALDDPDPLRRQPALQALGAAAGATSSSRLRDQLAERIEGLLSGGLHETTEVLAALGQARAPRSLDALWPYLDHPDPRLRLAAVNALAGYPLLPAAARERLQTRAEGDEDPRVREAARRALAGE